MKISACYIVKDEAAELARSLASVRAGVDEIVVVHTGTGVAVVAAAERYGAKVLEYAWDDDFAAARNVALAQATGDWIVFLDADEYFSSVTAGQLRDVVTRHAVEDALLLLIRNIDKDEQDVLVDFFALRIFKRRIGRHYEGRIHEQLMDGDSPVAGTVVAPDELMLLHTGYAAACSVEKARRNLRLLLAELKETKQPQRLYMYLAEAYDGLSDRAMAMQYAYLDIAGGRRSVSFASRSYRILLRLLAENRVDWQERQQVAARAVKDFPELPEFQAEYAECLAYGFDYAAAIEAGQQALKLASGYAGIEPSQFDAAAADVLRGRLRLWEAIRCRQGTLRVSACVIVRDEAENIGQWLKDAHTYSDEMIVVDTGSVDDTAAIAAAVGAKVYHFVWNDDFSQARNYALEQATGDWIVFLDADEYFADVKPLRPLLAETELCREATDAILVPIANIDVDDNNREIQRFINLRLFRRLPALRYVGRVHESVRRVGGKIRLYEETERILLYHTGYSGRRIRRKIERDLQLLQADIAVHGEGPQHYSYLADCYFGLKDYPKTLHYAWLAIRSMLVSVGNGGTLYHEVLESMRQLKQPMEEMLVVAEQAVEKFPRLPDFYAERGMILCGLGQLTAARESLERAVRLGEQPQDNREASYFRGAAPIVYRRLGELYLHGQELEKAEAALAKSLQRNKYQPEGLALYCRLHAAEGSENLAARLAVFYREGKKDAVYLARQMEKLGAVGLYRHYAALADSSDTPTGKVYAKLVAGDWLEAYQLVERIAPLDMTRLCQTVFCMAQPSVKLWQRDELIAHYAALLPTGMQTVLARYRGGKTPLEGTDFEGYIAVLQLLAPCRQLVDLECYVRLAFDFSWEQVYQAARYLYSVRQWKLALLLYEAIPADAAVVTGEFWHDAGICFYYEQNAAAALSCFAEAEAQGKSDQEMVSYKRWLEEGREI